MSTVLTSAQTRFLRGQAHDLKALLQIGAKGLTTSFIAELDGVLEDHELVKVKVGDSVVAGQELVVLEAMKMELAIKSPRDGSVAELRAQVGDFVEADAVLVTLEPLE